VDSLIAFATPEKRLPDHLPTISSRPFCSSDHDELPHYLPRTATWTNIAIAQKKIRHKTKYGDINYEIGPDRSNTQPAL
jgi:hypothetical protein